MNKYYKHWKIYYFASNVDTSQHVILFDDLSYIFKFLSIWNLLPTREEYIYIGLCKISVNITIIKQMVVLSIFDYMSSFFGAI